MPLNGRGDVVLAGASPAARKTGPLNGVIAFNLRGFLRVNEARYKRDKSGIWPYAVFIVD